MKLSKRQLKRIIREEYSKLKRKGLIRETFSDSSDSPGISPGDIYKKSELGRLPVEIDPSRHTHQSDPLLDIERAIEEIGADEGQSREGIGELKQVLHRLNDCLTHGDDPGICADKIFDAGLENAFHELGYILHDLDETGEINQYALDVSLFLQPEY